MSGFFLIFFSCLFSFECSVEYLCKNERESVHHMEGKRAEQRTFVIFLLYFLFLNPEALKKRVLYEEHTDMEDTKIKCGKNSFVCISSKKYRRKAEKGEHEICLD